MNDPLPLLNPLTNEIFLSTLFRALILYASGFLLIFALYRGSFARMLDSNVGKRFVSWLWIGPLYLILVFVGGYAALVFLLAVLLLALWEVRRAAKLPNSYYFALQLLALWSVFIASQKSSWFLSLPLVYFLVIGFVAIRDNNAKKSFSRAATCLYVSVWIIFSLSHFVLLGHLNNTFDATKALLVFLGFAVPLSDIGAYVVGRSLSKVSWIPQVPIASNLSPKKTYAGVLGNILGAGAGVAIMYFALSAYLPWYHWVLISILIGVMGVVGDITESMFKREYGIKDSSDLIAGHGGVLDRIDSLLRVVVVIYYYLLFVL